MLPTRTLKQQGREKHLPEEINCNFRNTLMILIISDFSEEINMIYALSIFGISSTLICCVDRRVII